VTDWIVQKYAQAREHVQARIDELDCEIVRNAVPFVDAATHGRMDLRGAGRRVLSDRVIERMCLEAVLEAHETALEDALDEERKRLEYIERVEKPQRELEAKQLQRKLKDEEHDARIRAALNRVRETINRVSRPAPEDVEVLRRNRTYSDGHNAFGSIDRLLDRHDSSPWWRTTDSKGK
jgi:hypothetical protein